MSKSKQKKQKSNASSSTALHQPVQASASSSLTSFSSTHYAHVSLALDSHTVRIFDIASGRCVNRWAAADETNEKVKAIHWVDISSPAPDAPESKRTKKRSRKSVAANGAETASESPKKAETASEKVSMLALGLSDGSILILHPTNAGVFKRLTHAASTQPINSLSCSNGANLLWSASTDGQIFVWSFPTLDGSGGNLSGKLAGFGKDWSTISVRYTSAGESGEDEPMQGNDATQKAQILIGKHNIKIIEVDLPAAASQLQDLSYKALGNCTGHPSAIASLEWVPSTYNLAFLSTAAADRTVHLWSLKPSVKEVEASLVATFGLDSHVHKTLISSSTASNFDLAAISGQGQVSIASVSLALFFTPEVNGKKSPAKAKIVSLRPVSEIAAQGGASSDSFTDLQVVGKGQLRLARSGMKPQFDVVEYTADGGYVAEVDVSKPSKGKGVLFQDEDEDENMGAPAVRSRPSNATASAQAPTAPLADFDESLTQQTTNPGEIDVDMSEPTLADRLKSLAVQKDTTSKEPSLLPVPSASLTSSLVQALHSNDSRLLESCLVHSKEKIIKSTVKRLPAHLVIPLVEALVERLGRSRRGYGVGVSGVHANRGKALIQWMRAVLVLHIAHLITIPGLVTRLSSLHRTIEARLELHQPLLALSGRLELVCSQIELRREAAQANKQRMATTAALELVEGEESEDDMAEEETDEGSVEDIVLGPRADSEDEESDDDEVEGLLDLEAEDSDDVEQGQEEEYHTESEGDVSDLIDDGSESGEESSGED